MSGWTQSIVVHTVDHDSLTTDVPNGTDAIVRVSVNVSHQGILVTTLSWYASYGAPPP